MPTTIYDSSLITKRRRDTTISGSFINRIQNPSAGSAPMLGISTQSIINSVKTGQMTTYTKSSSGFTNVSLGCPCLPLPVSNPLYSFFQGGWATNIGGTGSDTGRGISVDSYGNVYVTGVYNSTVTINNVSLVPFTPGPGVVIPVTPYGTLANSGDNDAFIVKYTATGQVQWATNIGGTGNDVGNGISVDSVGNVYVTGHYTSPLLTINNVSLAPFTPGPDVPIPVTPYGTLANSGDSDAFIVKYTATGQVQWATKIGGSSYDTGRGISVDSTGNVYVTGEYNSSPLTINSFVFGGVGVQIIVTPYGTLANSGGNRNDAFIVKYNANGQAQWATNIGGTGSDSGFGISVDYAGNVYVTGQYFSSLLTINSFSLQPEFVGGTINVTSYGTLTNTGGNLDAFIVKYNATGQAQWATNIQGTGGENGYGISVDSAGNVYVTGLYNSTSLTINSFSLPPEFVGGTINVTSYGTLANSGDNDAFIVKYNATGQVQWATNIGGTLRDDGNGISVDYTGNVYVTGVYTSPLLTINSFSLPPEFVGGTITVTPYGTLANSGSFDAFIVKYNASGQAQWATNIGGTENDNGIGISVDYTGNVYITGHYTSPLLRINNFTSATNPLGGPIGVTPYGTLANSSGNFDVFIVKYNATGQIV